MSDRRLLVRGGAVLSLLVAAALFSRYGIHGALARDEAVYAYGGQQVDAGVPFYVSIFDQKTPGAAYLAALGDAAGGFDGIRIAFFVCACLTALAVYLLALELWGSVLGALVAAVVFASFRGFAADALAGPDAKTPGILLAVLSMLFMARRQWLRAGLCGSLAFLFWQPLAIYAAVAVIASRRWRALAGALAPLVVTVAYFWASGALGDLVQAAFAFPVTGLHRTPETVGQRLGHIAATVHLHYAGAVVQFWAGLALVAALAAWRRSWVVLTTLVAIAGFSALDFQGYPDVYPLLPYAALGLGGAAALLARPRLLRPALAAAAAAVVAASWASFSADPAAGDALAAQRAEATAIARLLNPGDRVEALGDPTPLVLARERNPSRFIFLGSGVGAWEVARLPGGFGGWTSSIRTADPAVVVLHGWRGPLERRTAAWLHSAYRPAWIGCWRVFLRPDVASRAASRGVALGRSGCLGGGAQPEGPAQARQQVRRGADQLRAQDQVAAV